MKKNFNDPRAGLIVALGVLIAALWLVVAFGAYEESKRAKYDVTVKPGAVTYGTHSTVVIPMVSSPMHRSSVPMISGGVVRNYAYSGHATMPSATTGAGYRLHTTSSATMHTIGSGGGGGGMSGGGASSSSSSRGIHTSGGGFSVPTLALATPNSAAGTTTSTRLSGPRRAKPTDPGTSENDGQWSDNGEGDGDWWRWDDWAGEWVQPEDGDTRIEGGVTYKYVGTYPTGEWVPVNDQGDPVNPNPLGDAPWHWMLLLALGYGIVRTVKIRKQKLN